MVGGSPARCIANSVGVGSPWAGVRTVDLFTRQLDRYEGVNLGIPLTDSQPRAGCYRKWRQRRTKLCNGSAGICLNNDQFANCW